MCNGYDSEAYGELTAEVNGMRDAVLRTIEDVRQEARTLELIDALKEGWIPVAGGSCTAKDGRK